MSVLVGARTLANLVDRQGDVLVDETLLIVGMDLHQDRLRNILVVVNLRELGSSEAKLRSNSEKCKSCRPLTCKSPLLQTKVGAEQPTRPSRDPTVTTWANNRSGLLHIL